MEFSRVKRRRDAELRARLGLSDGDYVFLAAGESTRAAAHRDAIWAASILHVAGPEVQAARLGPRADDARRSSISAAT